MNEDLQAEQEAIVQFYESTFTYTGSMNNGENTISINVDTDTYPGVLDGRIITVKVNEGTEEEPDIKMIFNGTIVSNSGTVLTLSGPVDTTVLTGEPTDYTGQVDVGDDAASAGDATSLVAILSTPNPYILTNNDFPTYNDFFLNYSDFCNVFIGLAESWQDENQMNTYITAWNVIVNKDITIQDDVNSLITDVATVHLELDDYFDRLKKLLGKIKVSDKHIKLEDWEGMYNSKRTADKADIDTYYAYYLANDMVLYNEYKQTLLYDIKIVV